MYKCIDALKLKPHVRVPKAYYICENSISLGPVNV